MKFRKNIARVTKKLVFWRNTLSYRLHGGKPWSRGYFEHKWRCIGRSIGEGNIMTAFRNGTSLPKRFGQRVDERIVEYPWLLSRMPKGPATLLDAGSALNFETLLTHPALKDKKITIVTLRPESNCFWRRGVAYLFEDMRTLPFMPDSFDFITCISTLEHVGMDNTKIYTADPRYKENKAEDYLAAAAELRRVLKPGGTLFLTVPFGVHRNFGFFQQFDQGMIDKVVSLFGAGTCTLTFYSYADGGWQISTAGECAPAEYVTADRARKDASLAAAARAVVCLTLTK